MCVYKKSNGLLNQYFLFSDIYHKDLFKLRGKFIEKLNA